MAFHVMDREGHILHANARFMDFLGLAEGDDRGVGFERLRNDLPPEQARAWFLRGFDHSGEASELGSWLKGNGEVLPIRVSVVGLRTEAGDRLFVWGQDYTEEKQHLDQLMESAGQQRHLAEGIYALSLTRTREEIHQVLLGRATALIPGFH